MDDTTVVLRRRSGVERRLGERRGSSPVSKHYAETCHAAGSHFIGVQPGVPELGLADLVLFSNPRTGSTLALWSDAFSEEAVRDAVEANYERWRRALYGGDGGGGNGLR